MKKECYVCSKVIEKENIVWRKVNSESKSLVKIPMHKNCVHHFDEVSCGADGENIYID